MATKLVVLLSVLAAAQAGNLGLAPVAYSAGPAYSSSSISFGTPAIANYAAPLVTKTYAAPALGTSYSTSSISHGAPIAAYSQAAPAAYAQTIAAPAVATYANVAPVAVAKAYAAPAVSTSYSTQTIQHGAPAIASYAAPAIAAPIVAKSYAAPLLTKSYGAPALVSGPAVASIQTAYAQPILKSAIAYSAAPAVSHVSYTGGLTNYGW